VIKKILWLGSIFKSILKNKKEKKYINNKYSANIKCTNIMKKLDFTAYKIKSIMHGHYISTKQFYINKYLISNDIY